MLATMQHSEALLWPIAYTPTDLRLEKMGAAVLQAPRSTLAAVDLDKITYTLNLICCMHAHMLCWNSWCKEDKKLYELQRHPATLRVSETTIKCIKCEVACSPGLTYIESIIESSC